MKLSKKLIENAPWFLAVEAVIVLFALFMPLIQLSVLGATESMSLWDLINGAQIAEGHSIPWVFLLGLLGMSLFTTFFSKARKDDVVAAKVYLIGTVIGTVMMLAFALFMAWSWFEADMIEYGFTKESASLLKPFFSVGMGVWIPTVLAMTISGLAIYTYNEEK